VIERIIEMASRSAEAAEVICVETETRKAEFQSNRLKSITTNSVRGAGLRVIKDGRIGFSSTTDLSRPDDLVANALESAGYGREAKFAFPSSVTPAPVKVHDPRVVDFPIDEGVRRMADAIELVLAAFPRVKCEGCVSKETGRERIINSSGLDVAFDYTSFRCDLASLLVRDGSLLWAGDSDSSCGLLDVWHQHARKIINDIRAAQKEIVPPSGRYRVIFTPNAIDPLLASFEQGVNGKLVQKQISPFTGKLGEAIVDTRITLTDDGTIDYAMGSCPLDDEGLAVRRNVLIDKGVLKQFLFDLQTAGMMNAQPTGSGMRGFNAQPSPSITNLVIAPGDVPYEQMLADTKRGLLVEELLGAGQSNTLAGEFSANVNLGYLIADGEIVGRVKDTMLAGNIFEAFNRVAAVGDRQLLKGSLLAPHLCLDGLNVSSGEAAAT